MDQISAESKDRLVRYANAVRLVEMSSRKVYFRDGSYLDMGPSLAAHTEYSIAKTALDDCPEQQIRDLVYATQIERVDEAMEKSELDQRQADDNAMLAKNELVALGHKFKQEQEIKFTPRISSRRREHGRRNRRTHRRSCH
jgi:hypothetical protein